MGHCLTSVRSGFQRNWDPYSALNPLEDPRAKSQKFQLSWGTYSLKIADSGLFYMRRVLQNKQIATSKDMKDLELVEKICYSKNELTYPNKINKIILLYISVKMKKLVSFSLIVMWSMCCVNRIYEMPHLVSEVESSLNTDSLCQVEPYSKALLGGFYTTTKSYHFK